MTERPSTAIEREALDVLMPMHVEVTVSGHIRAVGPTIRKIFPELNSEKVRFLEKFEVQWPNNVNSVSDLLSTVGKSIRIISRTKERQAFRGSVVPLAQGAGLLVNLAFGINVKQIVASLNLDGSDFAPTDLTPDMLYLIEANALAMAESKRLNKKLEGAKSAAETQAATDTLTGLKNRRALESGLERLEFNGRPFGLMHLDLDYFKQVNDTLGHAAGDHVLKHVAKVLTSLTRASDLVARFGGDEFVMVFPDCIDLDLLGGIAERVIEELEKPIPFGSETCRISTSIGTTLSSFYIKPDIDQMLKDADKALYSSKKAGRACHTVFRVDAAE